MMRVQTAEVAQIDGKPKARAAASLEALYAQHQGNVADKWSTYLREYDRLLRDYREQPIRLLEIGVQNGGSLEIWAEFFCNAEKLIGCDIDPACEKLRYADPRVAVIVGNANSDETQRAIVAQASQLNVIVDDGSHRSSDIVQSFARYFPLLSDDGIYIIEDLHCSYWSECEGGLFHPHSSMTFLKRLADVINHEHWGVPRLRSDLLRGMSEQYGVHFHDQDLGRIHSIEFCNSLCVIRTAPTDDNALGTRVTVGSEEPVAEGKKALRGMRRPEHQDQTLNEWSARQLPPEDELFAKAGQVEAFEGRLSSVDAEVAALQGQLTATVALLAAAQEQRAAAETAAAALNDEITTLRTKLAEQSSERSRWRVLLTDRERQLSETTSLIADLGDSVSKLEIEHRSANRARDAVNKRLRKAEGSLSSAQSELKRIQRSVSWRLTKPLRQAGALVDRLGPPGGYSLATRRVRKVLREKGVSGATKRMFELMTGRGKVAGSATLTSPVHAPAPIPRHESYADWLRRYDSLKGEGRAALVARATAFRKQPAISVLMSIREPNLRRLSEAIESVRGQIYPHWELCIVDDASANPALRVVLERWCEQDPRIRLSFRSEQGPGGAAANAALDMASGDWIAFLSQDDVLREHALFWIVDALNRKHGAKLIYSDEDKLNERGDRCDPYFKCDWNHDLFLSQNMLSHLSVFAASLLREVGGLRDGFVGAHEYDLALRCVERLEPAQIHHVPRVLYSARVPENQGASNADPNAPMLAGQRALNEYFQRAGVLAHAEIAEEGTYRTRYRLPEAPPLVSLIIPTRNGLKLVRQCLESLFNRTTYAAYEVLLVDNGSDDPAALTYFAQVAKRHGVRVLRDDRPFNYSALNNMAVELAKGDFVCLLNNDIEVMSPYWLEEMVSIAIQPGVGAVGARLWYPNDTLQHGGVIIGVGGVAGHSHKFLTKGARGHGARADLIQSFSAVTGACLLIKRSTYRQLGGLNETDLKVAFNDVDFCLRVREAGYRNVWTPYANLCHHESATRGVEDTPEKVARFSREVRYMQLRWAAELTHDPAYNPNLSIEHEDFRLAWPPRV